ncbi:epithelial cell-transforming sequence 2 oncogene-like isoform X2 [Glandiceps talaboti]
MTTKAKTPRTVDPLASLREPTYPTDRMAQSVKKIPEGPALSTDNFKTHKMKNYMSTWTPILHKPSNDQIFIERRDLVAHWFDLWTDNQRKRFLAAIFACCKRSQLQFTQDWFADRIPLSKQDFTVVLPKFLSLHVFSFLDPRSLSRASMACWHWKFLTEQDDLWMPKCVKFGWFLPYSPDEHEYGAWKRHYINCLRTLDVVQASKGSSIYGTLSDGKGISGDEQNKKSKKRNVPTTDRPPWLGNDPKANDLENAYRAMMSSVNPNDPALPTSAYLYAGRFGINSKGKKSGKLSKSWSGSLTEKEYGAESEERRQRHRALMSGDDVDMRGRPLKTTLTESMALEAYRATGGALEQPWPIPEKRQVSRRKDLSGGHGDYPGNYKCRSEADISQLSGNYPSHANPRIIFISSRIPAAELVLDAVLFGVIPIVYEYEGTTLESLLQQLEEILAGRQAKSIGVFMDGSPVEIKLVQYYTTTLKTIENDEIRKFWETLCSNILPAGSGGHVDIFLPLAASEPGMELILQLGILTGLQFTSPMAVVGSSYAHLDSEWLISPDGITPPALYFNADQLKAWISTANLVQEAIRTINRRMKTYFDTQQRDLAAKTTGEIVFNALSLKNIKKCKEITPALTDAIGAMSKEDNVKPLEFIAQYLKDVSDGKQRKDPLLLSFSEDDNLRDTSMHTPRPQSTRKDKKGKKKEPERWNGIQSATQLQDHPDRRTSIAFEILGSEINYKRTLTIVKDVYVLPLKAALKSNKAIISEPNLQTIFTDIMNVLGLSRELIVELQGRLEGWGPHQCIADIFVKLTSRLKVYTNYMNNYAVSVATIDKCREQHPLFRAFLRRYDKKAATKMLTLQELFLSPTRRIGEYIAVLAALDKYTAPDHADKRDLATAIKNFRELQNFIEECKLRAEREKKLIQLQTMILNCPTLLEANRYLIRHHNVAHLIPQTDNIKSEYMMYQHIEDFGLFLFNDAVVAAVRTIKHFPFERSKEEKYKFYASVALNRLEIEDLPDTRYIRHGFSMKTPKRHWICCTETYDEKLSWMTAVEKAVQAAMQVD